MAKSIKEYKKGDIVVYPGHGVGQVDAVQVKKVGGEEHKFLEIIINDTGMKVMVPTSQADSVGLRKVVPKKTVTEVYTIIKDRKAKVVSQTWNRRHREYLQKIKTGSLIEIAEVIRDLLILSSGKSLSFGEKKMMDVAQNLLVNEISIVKSRPQEKILDEIQTLCA